MNPTIDIFETRMMLEALFQMKRPASFLLDNFFKLVTTSNSKHVDIDVWKGKRRLAPFVSPKSESKRIDRIGFSTNTYTPPYIKQKMPTDAQDFLKRLPGETIYAPGDSAEARAAKRLGMDLMEMIDMITRREEWMAASALQTGKINIIGEGINDIIDFLFDPSHLPVLLGDDAWNSATSNPISWLKIWRRKLQQDSGMLPTDVVLGHAASDALVNNPNVQNKFNKWWMNFGQFDVRPVDEHVVYLGRIQELGMDFWEYSEYFIDPADGIEKDLINPNACILATRKGRTGRHYGAIQDVESSGYTTTNPTPYYPKSWVEKDPSERIVQVQSAPLVAIHQPDAYLCALVTDSAE